MADVEKILRLVEEGALTPDEADEILTRSAGPGTDRDSSLGAEPAPAPAAGAGRKLRIEVSDGGRSVVNLRVPMNIAGWASSFLPGLSDDAANRIRAVISSGESGPILDVSGDDGSRVRIVAE